MLILLGALLGVVVGSLIAIRRKGKRLDILQYAAVYGILFALITLFLGIILERMVA